jgi:hypothetical protein
MRNTKKRMLAAGVGVLAIATVVPATAASAHHNDTRTNLVLSVKERGERKITDTLRCDPSRGSHPERSAACRELKKAKGKFRNLAGRQTFRACAKIYRPVTVEAEGLSRGWHVSYRKTFANRCEMLNATGSVWNLFDDDRRR